MSERVVLRTFTRRADFLIAGVQKAGTTSLDGYLRQHPQISMARKKEVHFFDKAPPTGVDALDWAIYNSNFRWPSDLACRVGEATPIYLWWHGALERIWKYNPDIKLIILLRDPVERAWSQYKMDVRLGRETLNFEHALAREMERSRRSLPLQDRERSLLDRGFYAWQVRRALRIFPREQLHFIKSEKLSADPSGVLQDVCDFLKCDAHRFDFSARMNSDPHQHSMPEDCREKLQEIYRFDVQETRRLLNWNCDEWSV